MSTATQNSDDFWNLLALLVVAYWWVGPIILGFIAGVYEVTHEILKTHHRRRLAIVEAKARVAEAQARLSLPYVPPAVVEAPGAGPCKHRSDVVPVISDGKRVAWLCRTCETQLPATYAVEPEDL